MKRVRVVACDEAPELVARTEGLVFVQLDDDWRLTLIDESDIAVEVSDA